MRSTITARGQTVIPAELLLLAQRGKAECLVCSMTGMELLPRVWRDEGEAAGRLAHRLGCALRTHPARASRHGFEALLWLRANDTGGDSQSASSRLKRGQIGRFADSADTWDGTHSCGAYDSIPSPSDG